MKTDIFIFDHYSAGREWWRDIERLIVIICRSEETTSKVFFITVFSKIYAGYRADIHTGIALYTG